MVPQLLIHPDFTKRCNYIEKLLADINLTREHHALLWFSEDDKLGIEQSRQIKGFLSLKPYQGENQAVVIVAAENLSLDAQNALLKTLEEPADQALIILGVASEDQLLATILSRCHINYLDNTSKQNNQLSEKDKKDVEKLLSSTVEERFVFIEKLKDRESFLMTLTLYFRGNLITHPTLDHQFLKDLIEAQKWANQNVNIRAILEYLMLKMPYPEKQV